MSVFGFYGSSCPRDSDARVPRPEPPPARGRPVDVSSRPAPRERRRRRVEPTTRAPRDRDFRRDRSRFLGRRRRRDRASEESSGVSRRRRRGRLAGVSERGLPRRLRLGGKRDARDASAGDVRGGARARLGGRLGVRVRLRSLLLGKRPIREESFEASFASRRKQSCVCRDEQTRDARRARVVRTHHSRRRGVSGSNRGRVTRRRVGDQGRTPNDRRTPFARRASSERRASADGAAAGGDGAVADVAERRKKREGHRRRGVAGYAAAASLDPRAPRERRGVSCAR